MLTRENNFDSLRFWAAMAVLWSHAFPIAEVSERHEPLFRLSHGQTTMGSLSVTTFFVISGYLITRSFVNTASPWRFVLARLLRIMPALLVVLLLVTFVLGPLVSSLPIGEYFSSAGPYRYLALQTTFTGWYDELPGVFADNPVPWVNGSLWTLRYEIECYALIFLLGVSGLLDRRVTLALYLAGFVYLLLVPGLPATADMQPLPNKHVELGVRFLAGALLYQFQVPLKGKLALAGAVVTLAALLFGHYALAARTVLPYAVMYLAIGPSMVRMPNMARWGDLSYGIYIYAWPVSQLVVLFSPRPHWFTIAAIATPIVLILSFVSWHGIEKVALSFKKRVDPRRPDSLQPSSLELART
jgi:peptidoglycan/LPS O-acetylase OafA/YrhL